MKITYRVIYRVGEIERTEALDFDMDGWQQEDLDRFVDFAREKLGGDGEPEGMPDGKS